MTQPPDRPSAAASDEDTRLEPMLGQIADWPIDRLVRPDLKQSDLPGLRSQFAAVISNAALLRDVGTLLVPTDVLPTFLDRLRDVHEIFDKISSLDAGAMNDWRPAVRDLAGQAAKRAEQWTQAFGPVLVVAVAKEIGYLRSQETERVETLRAAEKELARQLEAKGSRPMTDVLRWTGRVLVLLVIGSAVRIGVGLLSSSGRPEDLAASPMHVASVPGLSSERPVDSLIRVIRGTGLFRWEAPASAAGSDPSATPESRPALSISAVVGGQSPGVVLEGIPGIDGGRLVRAGDTIGGLRIQWIKGHQAGVGSHGSTWTLSLRGVP